MCLSFVSLTTKQLFVYFGANRKDVLNLTTTPTKKNKEQAFYLFFASCHAKRESQSHTRKKGVVVKSRGGYFFFRIMGRDFASSSAFKERKRFFFNRTRLKNWTHPTSRYRTYNHLKSHRITCVFRRCNTKRSVIITQTHARARTRERETTDFTNRECHRQHRGRY